VNFSRSKPIGAPSWNSLLSVVDLSLKTRSSNSLTKTEKKEKPTNSKSEQKKKLKEEEIKGLKETLRKMKTLMHLNRGRKQRL
jgi:hypothetical protein